MKKILLSLALASSLSFAYTIDTKTVELNWTAFKLLSKEGVKGSFDDYKVSLNKTTCKSLTKMLVGSTVTINSSSVDASNALKNANISNFFFKKFSENTISAKIVKMMEGNNLGTIELEVTMNKVTSKVPMQYTISKSGKFVATGVLDIMDFNLNSAYNSLATQCESYHKGVTWTQVNIGFELYINN
ncbi:MAG: YceI family protein [Campylobacterota bacterium]|nr:YceI family protein [Campylobacterota bacterium]